MWKFTLGFSFSVKLLHVISVTIRVVTIIKGKQATDSWNKIKTREICQWNKGLKIISIYKAKKVKSKKPNVFDTGQTEDDLKMTECRKRSAFHF